MGLYAVRRKAEKCLRTVTSAQGDTFSETLARPLSAADVAMIGGFFAEGGPRAPLVGTHALKAYVLKSEAVRRL